MRNARKRLVAACAALALTQCGLRSAMGQSFWNGSTGDWNTAGNWIPNVVPNSASTAVEFLSEGVTSINLSASVSAQSILFQNYATNETLTSSSGVSLSGVQSITAGAGISGTDSINLASISGGSLLFPSSGNLTITNVAPSSASLVIGPNTVIGTAGSGGVIIAGSGLTDFKGTLASNVTGGITFNGGSLSLDYSSNAALKIAAGSLSLDGGTLSIVANSSSAVTQNIPGGTLVSAGQTQVVGSGTGTITLAAKAITHGVGGTIDFSPKSSGPAFSITTTTGNTNGLLGAGPAFATINSGSTWATNVSGSVIGLTTYGTNTYSSGTNTDVTSSSSQSAITTNSLRFNSSGSALTLTLSGTDTIQSGGILMTGNSTGATITGGTLTAAGGGELLIHQYSSNPLVINSKIVSSIGLTKSGPGPLTLGGDTTGLTGATKINDGTVTETAADFYVSTTSINVSGGALTAGSLFSNSSGYGSLFLTDPAVGSALNLNGTSSTSTYSGSISGTGSLNKSGSSTQIFTGVDNFTGNVLVSGGAVVFNSASAFTSLNVSGGVAQISAGTLALAKTTDNPLFIDGATAALNISNGAIVNFTSNDSLAATIDGAAIVTVTGNSSQLNATGTGQQVRVGNASSGTLDVFNGATFSSSNELLVGGYQSGASAVVNISSGSSVTSPLTIVGFFSGSTGNAIINGTLTASQGLELGGSEELGQSGGTAKVTVDSGGVINAGLITFSSNLTTLNISGGMVTAAGLSSSTGLGLVMLTNPATAGYALNLNVSTATQYYAGLISGSGGLYKTGAYTQELGGTNTFTGNINVSGGTLELATTVAASSAIVERGAILQLDVAATGASAPITLDGGTLNLESELALTALTSPINITANGGTLQAPTAATFPTLTGLLNGPSGALSVPGPGTVKLQLSNSSTSTLASIVATGPIQVTSGNLSLATSGNFPLLVYGGAMQVSGGAVVSSNASSGQPDAEATSGGVISVNGSGSKFEGTGGYSIFGSFGAGSLVVSNYGAASFQSDIYLGESGGTGTITINTGGTVTSRITVLADDSTCTGIVTVDGAGSSLTDTYLLEMGGGVAPTSLSLLSITNAGNVNAGIIDFFSDSATINVSGGSLSTGPFSGTYTGSAIHLLSDPTGGYALNIYHTGIGDFETYSGSITGSGSVNVSSGVTQTFAGNDSFGKTIITGGTLVLSGTNRLGSMNISSGTVQITGTENVLSIPSLTIGTTGTLDLTTDSMNISSSTLSTINTLAKLGFDNGAWDGSGGITSSSAAADTTHLTAVGVMQNNQSGTAMYNASHPFHSVIPGTSDILAACTYYGDTNLDGKVDASDYSRIDSGFVTHATGWFNGDFNYDGTINGSDYTLIDNAFNTQSTQLSAEVATPTAQLAASTESSVPEPAMLGLVGIGTFSLLGRRIGGKRSAWHHTFSLL